VQSDEEDRPLAVVIGKAQAKRARKWVTPNHPVPV
jgi:hypothetical protein